MFPFSPKTISLLALLALLAALQNLQPILAQPRAISWNAKSNVAIVLPQNASLPEQTAAQELDDYLTKITDGEFSVQPETEAGRTPGAIYVGDTQFAKGVGVVGSTLAPEEWRIVSKNGNLVLIGGSARGTLYTAYHFLEDVAGVRWWNPWEETVPTLGVLPMPEMDVRGKPIFS